MSRQWRETQWRLSGYRISQSEVEEVVGGSAGGGLEGRVKIKLKDGRLLVGYFRGGVLHGFAR